MSLETKILDIIDGKKKPSFWLPALRVCSFLYGVGIASRHLAYNLRLCKTHTVPTCVISVGNIACGGTGKTPFVRFLAKALNSSNVAILSRGYRSSSEHLPEPLLISGEHGPVLSATTCGDEPYLLASALPGVKVWVGKHRYKAAHSASVLGIDAVILDDGMQYRKLTRDIEIVLVDGHDILAGKRLLPSGRLRDFPSRLRSANLIVINHAEEAVTLSSYEAQLRPFTQAPCITVRTRSVPLSGKSIAGKSVGVFCALGRPERFFSAVRNFPSHIVATLVAPDHTGFSADALHYFALDCQQKGAEFLVCSAKDSVKLSSRYNLPLPLVVMDTEIEILHGKETWEKLLDRIKGMIKKRKSL